MIDVRAKSNNGYENYHVTKQDFMEWEEQNGRIPHGAIIFILTGCSQFYGNRTRYFGYHDPESNEKRSLEDLHFPGKLELIV